MKEVEQHRWPPLYKKAKDGKITEWNVWVTGKTIYTTSGVVGQKMRETKDVVPAGKNIGRRNETTAHEQAVLEAQAKVDKKIDNGYVWEKESALEGKVEKQVAGGFYPMLAFAYDKHGAKIQYPCYVQPKYDGCVSGETILDTDRGPMRIDDIVFNRLDVKVRSYNVKSKKEEYRKVVNWFDNGMEENKRWMRIRLSRSQYINCTENHKIYTDSGWKRADQLTSDDRVLGNAFADKRKSRLLGTLLGDSSLTFEKRGNSSKHVRLLVSSVKRDFLDFKLKVLGFTGVGVRSVTSGYGSKMFTSSANMLGVDFPKDLLYYTEGDLKGKRRKVSAKELLRHFTPESLALLIADDGSLSYNNGNKNTPLLAIHTEGWDIPQIEDFISLFEKRFKCTPRQNLNSKVIDGSGIFLTFNTKDTLYLMNLVRDLVVPGNEYKFYFNYSSDGWDDSGHTEFRECAIERSRNCPPRRKFDIEVEGNHNYFANNILVHNCRAVAIEGKFFSRMRKPFPVIKHLQEEIEKHPSLLELPLDGELYHHDLKEDFELIVSAIKREKEPSPLTQSIQYHVYDLNIPGHYHERLETIERLKSTIKSKAIKFVETRLVKNEREMRAAYEDFMEQGYEGAMLRNVHGQYECRRSYNLQKVKEFQDTEFRIVDIQEGRGALQGCVGAFVCEMQETKATFNVKLKGKDVTALLRRCFTDHSLWKSRWITVQHQGFTKNGLPRFPVGVRLRGAE